MSVDKCVLCEVWDGQLNENRPSIKISCLFQRFLKPRGYSSEARTVSKRLQLLGIERLKDDSVESADGRIILYSVTRFLDEIANGNECFICGAKSGTKQFNREHVIPDWVLRDRGLHSGNIALPNKGAVMYGRYTVPCCSECNTKMATIFENPISDAFARGWKGVTDLIRKDGGRLLWLWLALIFLKAHLKHRKLRWHLNRKQGDARIADAYD